MTIRAITVWFVLLFVAFGNGWFREVVLLPRVGSQVAHVVSSLMLCLGILAVSYAGVPWIRPVSVRGALMIGGGWLLMTLAFEFGFGRLRGRSWEELFADYNILAGRVWIVVLITTAVAPLVIGRMRQILSPEAFP